MRLTDLPSNLAELYDPSSDRFTPPVDDRGIIDEDLLVELGVRTFDGFIERPHERNVHHVYNTEMFLKQVSLRDPSEYGLAAVFNNLTPHRILLPIELHQHIERITLAPIPPTADTMRRRVLAWKLADTLFNGIRRQERLEREIDAIPGTRKVLTDVPGEPPSGMRLLEVVAPLYSVEVSNRDYIYSQVGRHESIWDNILRKALNNVKVDEVLEELSIDEISKESIRTLRAPVSERFRAIDPREQWQSLIAAA